MKPLSEQLSARVTSRGSRALQHRGEKEIHCVRRRRVGFCRCNRGVKKSSRIEQIDGLAFSRSPLAHFLRVESQHAMRRRYNPPSLGGWTFYFHIFSSTAASFPQSASTMHGMDMSSSSSSSECKISVSAEAHFLGPH